MTFVLNDAADTFVCQDWRYISAYSHNDAIRSLSRAFSFCRVHVLSPSEAWQPERQRRRGWSRKRTKVPLNKVHAPVSVAARSVAVSASSLPSPLSSGLSSRAFFLRSTTWDEGQPCIRCPSCEPLTVLHEAQCPYNPSLVTSTPAPQLSHLTRGMATLFRPETLS